MNHIHQIIWNKNLGAWIVASELAKRGKKRGSIRRKALILPLLLYASAGFALPTGNELVAGSVNVTTPSAQQMQINQSSQKAIVNWQGFSIGQQERVNIQQPNASAALLNRVVGQDASNIQGRLNANGQVYLTNPNGVIFSKTAQVDVGGLIASTHDISNRDFLNGNLHFTKNNATGSVINHGQIKTPKGGVVALIGEQVENTGSIRTPKGTTALAAGESIDLDMQGDGLVEVKITEAALKAQIKNNGVIQADGGQVVMTARAAGQLLNTVINNQGVVEARGLVERNGKIVLSGGDNGVVQVSGTLDVSGQATSNNVSHPASSNMQGGTITVSGAQIHINNGAKLNASGNAGGGTIVIGDKQTTSQTTLHSGSRIAAHTRDHGKAGTIEVLANKDNGTVKVAGQLNASAPKHGDGGFIDTSAAHVKVADTAKINTTAAKGKTGTWLIDPTDFTIAASGGDITGTALSINLTGGNVTIASTAGSTGVNGDVNVNDEVSWAANQLTLNAQRNININADLNGSGTAQLALEYGQASAGGGIDDNYFINNGAKVTLPAGANFSTQKGSNVANLKNYTVITSLGAENSFTATDLQGMNGNLNINYALGADIDASVTSTWNDGAGFLPVGHLFDPEFGEFIVPFSGNFDGLGHTISSLWINRETVDGLAFNDVGLFGWTSSLAVISNLTLESSKIFGNNNVGGLAGSNEGLIQNVNSRGTVSGNQLVGGLVGGNYGIISNAYTTGNVTGIEWVGGFAGFNSEFNGSISDAYTAANVAGTDFVAGLVGINEGTISSAYSTGNVTGSNDIGGLVGRNYNLISNAYASGNVSGESIVGGLVGSNYSGEGGETPTINNAYATGSVEGNLDVGGLVGGNEGIISSAYATGSVAGTEAVGGLVGENYGDINNVYATGNVNGIGDGVGGLVGINNSHFEGNSGIIDTAYATGNITSTSDDVGGLVGYNSGAINNAYATSNVSGVNFVGGLVGDNSNGSISNAYATGSVNGISIVGGLVGNNDLGDGISGNISNSFWDKQSTGQSIGVGLGDSTGATGKNTAEMKQLTNFSSADWNISDTGGSAAVWRIYESFTAPLLRNFLTALTVTADNISKTYDGVIVSTLSNPNYSIPDAATSGHLFNTDNPYNGAVNVSTISYNATGLYSDQQGYDISLVNAALTINPAKLTAAIIGDPTKTYDGNTTATLVPANYTLTGFIGRQGASVTQTTGTYNSANVVTADTVTATLATSDFIPDDGTLLSNYSLPDSATGSGTIGEAALTATIIGNPTKTYDGSTVATLTPANFNLTGFIGGQGAIITQTAGTYNSADVVTADTVTAALAAANFTANAGTLLSNYSFPITASGAGHINPALLTAAIIGNPSKTYDGSTVATLAPAHFNLTGFIGGQGASVTQTAGTYNSADVVTADTVTTALAEADFTTNSGTLLSNYSLPVSATGIGTISEAALNAAIIGNPTKIYDGNTIATLAPANFNLTGFIGGQGASVTQTAGTYNSADVVTANTITATLASSDLSANDNTLLSNYNFPITASGAGHINPALLTAAITGNPTKTYDGNTAATLTPANFNLTGFIGGQGVSVTQTVGTYNSADVVVADTVTATLATSDFIPDDGSLLSNYSLPDSATGSGTIGEAALTATIIGNPTKTYDGSTVATLTPANYNLTGFIGGQGASVTQAAGTYNSADVVTADTVTATLANSDLSANDDTLLSNYIFPKTASGAGHINQALLSAAIIGNPTKTYDGNTAATLTPANFTLTGFIGGQGVSVTQTVGTYNSADVVVADTVTATLAASDFITDDGTLLSNYSLPDSATGSGTIGEAALTATIIGNPTKTYDGSTVATLTPANFNLTGLIGGQGTSVTQTAGTYNSADVVTADTVTTALAAADFAADEGTLLSNYTLPTSAIGGGHINPRTLVAAIISNPTKPYDGNTTATLTPANFNPTGFLGGQGASVTQTAGSYNSADIVTADTVTATLAAADFIADDGTHLSNYSLPASASGPGAITPATLTITANDDRKIYDGSAYTGGNGVTYTGLVNNETSSVLSGSLTYGGNSQGAIYAGAYDITPGGLNSANYTITFINGQLTILNRQAIPDNVVTSFRDNTVPQVTSVTYEPPLFSVPYQPSSTSVHSDLSVKDNTEEFAGNAPQYCDDTIKTKQTPATQRGNCQNRPKDERALIIPTLAVKNSAGRVQRLQMSANKQFLSLLLEDGSIRIWDFQRGDQHQIVPQNKNQAVTDISAVDDKGELISVASKAGIGTQEVIIPTLNDKLAMNEPDIRQFMTSNDGSLLLVSAGTDQLSLWDSKHNKKLWQLPYERGVVNGLALNDNKHYGAVLSRQPGSYVLLPTELQLKSLTDAVDIVDLDTGKVIKSLPNVGEQILSLQFKDNDTLQLKLASGELLDWSIATNSPKTAANFAETVTAVDTAKENYAYVLEDGTVRIGDGQGHVLLSIQNKENPFKDAMLLDGDKKLLTVMTNGELSLWDVESGKKLLRLFSTQQGWTVMDAFGRFDGSEEAMDNFSWLANEEDIPLDSFSENYYEPGLLSNVLQNQDYLNSNPNMVQSGITLPPKVVLQIAEQPAKSDKLALQLDVYDRGGGIDKIHVYQNGKILSNENVVVGEQLLPENGAEHRILTLNITPSAGKNTLKVVASNDMGIENRSTELSFDGKTKAYASSLKLLTIGIDEYSDPKLNLKYSVTDADAIGQAMKNTSKVAASINLYNENATKPRILAELKELSQGVQQDVLVIYFAGHGLALGKEWYFLPYETTMLPTLEQIAATGITATELSDIFKNSKIQHILLMVDSCYSGAGMDAFSKLENGQRYFTRKLSRSLGITVMAAAAKDQKAFELKSLGHGLFTYLVTQELQEKTATQPVTAHGIAESISETLPVFSKKMLGASQEPAVYAKGNDFMLTDVLKESDKDSESDGNTYTIVPKKTDQ